MRLGILGIVGRRCHHGLVRDDPVLEAKRRRLTILEVQAAQTGYKTSPEVTMEIEDLRTEIAALERGER